MVSFGLSLLCIRPRLSLPQQYILQLFQPLVLLLLVFVLSRLARNAKYRQRFATSSPTELSGACPMADNTADIQSNCVHLSRTTWVRWDRQRSIHVLRCDSEMLWRQPPHLQRCGDSHTNRFYCTGPCAPLLAKGLQSASSQRSFGRGNAHVRRQSQVVGCCQSTSSPGHIWCGNANDSRLWNWRIFHSRSPELPRSARLSQVHACCLCLQL